MYLERFVLPLDKEEDMIYKRMEYNGGKNLGYIDNIYPCDLFSKKLFREVNFDDVTIFYGGNGSGKSTLLNLIANKLELNRVAPYNSSELFDEYTQNCQYELGYDDEGYKHKLPDGSRIITSDDVFDYMLTVRTNNADIAENIEEAREKWAELKFGDTIKFSGMDDYEALRMQVMSRRKTLSRRKFIQQTAGKEVKLASNGETALEFFDSKIKNDTLTIYIIYGWCKNI